MKTNVKLLLFASLLAFGSCGDNNQNDSENMAEEQNEQKFDNDMQKDADFAVDAAQGGMMEVQLGKLAQSNASSAAVKDFGDMMVRDHSAANDELKSLAAQKNITLPTSLSDDKQQKVNDLSQKKGEDFDKAYIDLMVDDHKKDIDEFQKEANNGNDADIKSWASGKVPVLQGHLDKAQSIQDNMK